MALQKKAIEKIVGKGNVLDDEASLATYSSDQSAVEARRPDMVAFVETVEGRIDADCPYCPRQARRASNPAG